MRCRKSRKSRISGRQRSRVGRNSRSRSSRIKSRSISMIRRSLSRSCINIRSNRSAKSQGRRNRNTTSRRSKKRCRSKKSCWNNRSSCRKNRISCRKDMRSCKIRSGSKIRSCCRNISCTCSLGLLFIGIGSGGLKFHPPPPEEGLRYRTHHCETTWNFRKLNLLSIYLYQKFQI